MARPLIDLRRLLGRSQSDTHRPMWKAGVVGNSRLFRTRAEAQAYYRRTTREARPRRHVAYGYVDDGEWKPLGLVDSVPRRRR